MEKNKKTISVKGVIDRWQTSDAELGMLRLTNITERWRWKKVEMWLQCEEKRKEEKGMQKKVHIYI